MTDVLMLDKTDLRETISGVFVALQGLPGVLDNSRTGIAFTLSERLALPEEGGDPVSYNHMHEISGSCPPEKELVYRYFSLRKDLMLLLHPECIASFELADPEAGSKPIFDRNWGGGIQFTIGGHDLIFTASGLPWKCDEALCVVTAWAMGWIDFARLTEHAKRSDNEVIASLYNAVKRMIREK